MHGHIHHFESLPQVEGDGKAAPARSAAPVRGEPLVGLIRNPHSHGNGEASRNAEDLPGVLLASPHRRGELQPALADFAAKRVDYIAIDGGDGTVRDVITCGAGVFGESWPELILLPSGKTNALAHDLGVTSDWTLDKALAAAKYGKVVVRRPMVVSQRDNDAAQVRGFILGAGAYTRAISLGQRAHGLGAFNAAAVGVTAGWSLLQAFFGSRNNPWRRGVRMRLRDDAGKDLPHAGHGPAEERYMIFASTLENFPAGLVPFKGIEAPLRLGVLDDSRRSLLARLPWIFRGAASETTARRGYHTHGLENFEFDIADRFILDGEAFPPGSYRVTVGPRLRFIVP